MGGAIETDLTIGAENNDARLVSFGDDLTERRKLTSRAFPKWVYGINHVPSPLEEPCFLGRAGEGLTMHKN